MTKRVHPTIGLTADRYAERSAYKVIFYQSGAAKYFTETELKALGFTPVEEKGDWIDKALEDYLTEANAFGVKTTVYQDLFRRAIEKHLPKQELIPLHIDKIIQEIQLSPPAAEGDERGGRGYRKVFNVI